uniref:M14 family metallopeptidase n=1 Tax=Halalkalibacterium ligniniphilum TaxID=1134413 RepID=UPI000367DACF
LEVDRTQVSLTEVRQVNVTVELPEQLDLPELEWTFGGKPFSEWKKWDGEAKEYSGEPFITVVKEPSYVEGTNTVELTLEFGLPYDTDNLAPRSIRVLYPELIGEYELAVANSATNWSAQTTLKLNVYDEFLAYEEIKPAIDEVFAKAQDNRYLEYKSLGQSVEGRDIHFVVLAKSEAAIDKYLNETLPTALENPAELIEKLEAGTMGDYQIPIWFNNIHPDEVEGVDAQVELLKKLALENKVTFKTEDETGVEKVVTLNVDEVLDHVIFLFNFTHNPDGRVANTRANANGFDLNRDNAHQTQVETIQVNEEIAKWTPLSFIDLHGYVEGFLIEPGTPPHNPNFEYDLLINSMIEQAHAMGRAGIANSQLDSYFIPLLDGFLGEPNGWDDMTPAYTAIFAMLHGSLGHTVEVPTLSQDSLYAAVHLSLGATNYVLENKDELFKNQLEIFKRGVEGEDNRAVDSWYVNQAGDEIGRVRGDHDNFFPDYYVIPSDETQKNVLEAKRMVEYLIRNGIKVEETTEAVTVNGVEYGVGTYIVPMNQAKRGLANAVLYPGDDISDWDAMYDAIVVNFPALRGFDSVEIRESGVFNGKTAEVASIAYPAANLDMTAEQHVISNSNNDVVKLVNELLDAGADVHVAVETIEEVQQGDYIVSTDDLAAHAGEYVFDALPLTVALETEALSKAKVAVIGSSQSRYVVEQLGFDIVAPEEADVIIDDAGRFTAEQVAGKTYIGIGGRSLQAVQEANVLEGFASETTRLSHEGLVQTAVSPSLLTAGYEAEELFYVTTGTWISSVPENAEVLATISAEDDFFVSGWWPGHTGAKGQALATSAKTADASYTLFANDLTFRAHTQHSYRLLANSIYAASIKKPVADVPGFSDVKDDHWAKASIEALAQRGVINGYADGAFKPNRLLVRGQAAELLANALDLEVPSEVPEAPFPDLTVESYHAPFAAAVKEAGVIMGKKDGTFGTGDSLTREQMATILVRAFNLQRTDADVTFTDAASISAIHKENVEILAQHGITTETTFRPKEAVSRAQFATFLFRVLDEQ